MYTLLLNYWSIQKRLSNCFMDNLTVVVPSLGLPATTAAGAAGLVSSCDSGEGILDQGEEADNQLQQTHQSSPQGASHTTSTPRGQGDTTLGEGRDFNYQDRMEVLLLGIMTVVTTTRRGTFIQHDDTPTLVHGV